MLGHPSRFKKFLRPKNYYRFLLWRFKLLQIKIHSKILNQKLTNSGGRGLFIDCGSNVGQAFEFFRKFYPEKLFDYILFEPNPHCFDLLSRKYSKADFVRVEIRNEAVGIINGLVDFYGLGEERGGIYSVGGTVLREHNSKMFKNPNKATLQVRSVDFSSFIEETLKSGNYTSIVMKLDMEGGEYAVLDSLISKNLLGRFNTIYAEFHSQYMANEFAEEYRNKKNMYFKEAREINIKLINWI